ncbi:MAG: heavy metal translocating P-type ATPase, partial [Chlamydiia bacterium]|nr:heavy metal translocating P-type ATPase [Chlamydiia bacterium]
MASSRPLIFGEYFETGRPETASPFLTPTSRHLGHNLPLKSALTSAFLLIFSFCLIQFTNASDIGYFTLILVYFFAGIPSLIDSVEDLANMQINIDVLMTLAAFGSVLIGSPLEGALLLVLFAISGAMEDAVETKAKSALSHLHSLRPTRAFVVEDEGHIVERAVQDITVGTHIRVKSGEVVPLDGTVIKGASAVNLVHLTGENLPVTKTVGDAVPAGGQNLEGSLTLSVTHTSADSTLARIIQLVTQAQEARPKLQRWFDALSKRYATTIITLALSFTLLLPLVLGIPFFGTDGSLYRSLAFLIAASPCALIIAIPIAYLSAVSICAKRGILLKGGVVLDSLARCHAMAMDKTGTLTTGQLRCTTITPLNTLQYSPEQALAAAQAMELHTVHPIAEAIDRHAKKQKITPFPLDHFKTVPGYGIQADIHVDEDSVPAQMGNLAFITRSVDAETKQLLTTTCRAIEEQGELLAILKLGDDLFIFRFQDTLRPGIKETIQTLKQHNDLQIIMLTGDHPSNARAIAKAIGIDDYYANLK